MATQRGAAAATYLITRGWTGVEQDPDVIGDPVLKDPETGQELSALNALGYQRARDHNALYDLLQSDGWDSPAALMRDIPKLITLTRSVHDTLTDISGELRKQAEGVQTLYRAIVKHHAQKADDRCFLDDDELYAAAKLPPVDRRVGDKLEMLRNCERFLANRCEGGGPWKSYAELEKENAELRARLGSGT